MAGNAIYPKWKEAIIQASPNSSLAGAGNTGVFCALVNTTSYVYSATHQFYTSLIGSPDAVIGTDQEITTKTYTNGTFKGDNLTYTAVSGTVVGALVLYIKASGSPDISTSNQLFLYEDTGVTGLPVTPNGGNITVTWNASGIVTISDRRVKEDIRIVGELEHVGNVYEYNYIGEYHTRRGLIAQEVEQRIPGAVVQLTPRLKAINYAKIVEHMEMAA